MRNFLICAILTACMPSFHACTSPSPQVGTATADLADTGKGKTCCMPSTVGRFSAEKADSGEVSPGQNQGGHEGMVEIPGGTFMMGGNNDQASPDEYPGTK